MTEPAPPLPAAVLWDLDGTLVDTEPAWITAEKELAARFGVPTTVTFAGDPENPTLNIDALYNVKRYHERDLGVVVNLSGPLLPYPVIDLQSRDEYGYQISTTDVLSYLLTGKPGFDFGRISISSSLARIA